jgi:hypothetical protein
MNSRNVIELIVEEESDGRRENGNSCRWLTRKRKHVALSSTAFSTHQDHQALGRSCHACTQAMDRIN